jgi:hypothetical protein
MVAPMIASCPGCVECIGLLARLLRGWRFEPPPPITPMPVCYCTSCGEPIYDTSTATVDIDLSVRCPKCATPSPLTHDDRNRIFRQRWTRAVQIERNAAAQGRAINEILGGAK